MLLTCAFCQTKNFDMIIINKGSKTCLDEVKKNPA